MSSIYAFQPIAWVESSSPRVDAPNAAGGSPVVGHPWLEPETSSR